MWEVCSVLSVVINYITITWVIFQIFPSENLWTLCNYHLNRFWQLERISKLASTVPTPVVGKWGFKSIYIWLSKHTWGNFKHDRHVDCKNSQMKAKMIESNTTQLTDSQTLIIIAETSKRKLTLHSLYAIKNSYAVTWAHKEKSL